MSKKMATCHPDRPHVALGLCSSCYYRQYRERPGVLKREQALARERYKNNEKIAERQRAYRRKYHQEHKNDPEYLKRNSERCQEHYRSTTTEEARRRQFLKQRYGITPEDYATILNEQGGRCAICGKSVQENGKSLCVDHDHTTGKIRGLLCISCNLMLGNAKDDINMLQEAINYLEWYREEV